MQHVDYPPCVACGRKHQGRGADRCVRRGTAFQIPSDRLKIERYNTILGDKPKIPVPEPPPKPARAYHSQRSKPIASSAIIPQSSPPITVPQTPDVSSCTSRTNST